MIHHIYRITIEFESQRKKAIQNDTDLSPSTYLCADLRYRHWPIEPSILESRFCVGLYCT